MSANRTTISENIGTQIVASDSITSSALHERPPLGIKQNLVGQPVRDGLLADGVASGASHKIGERGLAASNGDGFLKRDNVRFLHEDKSYTRILVGVNKIRCLTDDKEPCTVLTMTRPKTKPGPRPAKPKRVKALHVGPDGMTFQKRIVGLMTLHDPPIGQTELARMCSEYYATFVPHMDDMVKQQHVFNLLRGQSSTEYLPILAAVLDVNELWLQFGIGPKERRRT